MEETIDKLNAIFRDVLDNETIQLKPETTAADIEEWDSLSHMMLMAEIEKQFRIKFTSSEITKFRDVGDLVNSITGKKA